MELTKEQKIYALQRLQSIAAKYVSHEEREIRDMAIYVSGHVSIELEKLHQ